MSKALKLVKDNASNPKLWLLLGIGVSGAVVVLAETRRRRRRRTNAEKKEFFGAFVERFELLPFPPAPNQVLCGLTFAIKDMFVFSSLTNLCVSFFVCIHVCVLLVICRFDVKGYVTGFGNPDWKRTHHEAENTAIVVTVLLRNGATCVGKTVMDEFSFG